MISVIIQAVCKINYMEVINMKRKGMPELQVINNRPVYASKEEEQEGKNKAALSLYRAFQRYNATKETAE